MLPGGGAEAKVWDIARHFSHRLDTPNPPFDVTGLSEDNGLAIPQPPDQWIKRYRAPLSDEEHIMLHGRGSVMLEGRGKEDRGRSLARELGGS